MQTTPPPGFLRPSDVSRGAWRTLVARSQPSDPSLLPEMVLDSLSDEREPLLYWRDDGARASSLAVLEPRRVRLVRAPVIRRVTALRGLRVIGSDLFGEIGPRDPELFVDAACRLLDSGSADCVLFEDLATSSPLAAPVAAAERQRRVMIFRPAPPQSHWYIQFPSPAEDYWKALSSRTRYGLRRKARALGHRLVRVTEKQDLEAFFRAARLISERSWQGKRLGLRVRGSQAEIRQSEVLADMGALRFYLLERDDGTPLAFLMGSQWQGRFSYEETGYDVRHAELSPGTVLLYRVIEDLVAHDTPDLLDFGAGDGEHKRRFGNRTGESGPVVLLRGAGRPRASYHLGNAWRASDARARDLLRRTGLYRRVRNLYRGR